jgi:hypothetical protein
MLNPGDVILADALFDDYFIAWELCHRGIDIVAHAQYERTGSWIVESRPDGDLLVWPRPNKPRGMTGEQYRSYPKQLVMRQVTVDARDKNNRPKQFNVVTTILAQSIDGKQIGDLYERRWEGETNHAHCDEKYTFSQRNSWAYSRNRSAIGSGTMVPAMPARRFRSKTMSDVRDDRIPPRAEHLLIGGFG